MRARQIVLALLVLFAAASFGCGNYRVVANFAGSPEIFTGSGTYDALTKQSIIQFTGQDSGITCRGNSVTTMPSMHCEGIAGWADLMCDDGVTLRVHWMADSCSSGAGSGFDRVSGRRVRMAFAKTQDEALARLLPGGAASPSGATKARQGKDRACDAGSGTGFFISSAGHIITNAHVVQQCPKITVIQGRERIPAILLAADPPNDVALLKVERKVRPLPLENTDKVNRADDVFTLGYPETSLQGFEQKATFGRINALTGFQGDIRGMQVDVPIQHGNSGGPLINGKGNVVGITTGGVPVNRDGEPMQNVNYAVKTEYIRPLLRDVPLPAPFGQVKTFKELVPQCQDSVVRIVVEPD